MKANELRIGNLVWISSIYILDVYRSEEKINIHHLMNLTGWKEPMVDIEPIPLTREIILRFGAKPDELEFDCFVISTLTIDYKFYFTNLIDGDFYWTCNKVLGDNCFSYVHQLQNLYFALTGTELELI